MNLLIFIIISLCVGLWIYVQRDKFMLNSDSLHKQWLFRLAIAFPIVSSLYFIVWLSAPYPPKWDAYGYNTFLEINKFSLGILALSPILGAFVVSAHRSIQTTKQIEVTEKKNKVDIYFSERKFIIEQLEDLELTFCKKISNASYIYKKFRKYKNYSDENNNYQYNIINDNIKTIHELMSSIDLYIKRKGKNELIGNEFKIYLRRLNGLVISTLCSAGVIFDKPLKIGKIISDFIDGTKNNEIELIGKIIHIVPDLDLLQYEISDELTNIYNSLQELFSILLLDEDIFKFLPELQKTNYFTKDDEDSNF
ncbi:TPA: hypothetical protein ACWL6U_002585 [Morganella morganii]